MLVVCGLTWGKGEGEEEWRGRGNNLPDQSRIYLPEPRMRIRQDCNADNCRS